MTRQVTSRRLTKPIRPPAPPPATGLELKLKSKLDASGSLVFSNAKILKFVQAEFSATSELKTKITSTIKASATLSAVSDVIASAVPFKAARFEALASSDMPILQSKINMNASTRIEGSSGLAAKATKIVKMPPLTLNAESKISKCQAIVPFYIDGITMLGFPNDLGIDV